jgi:hypothetical protein
MAVEPRLSRLAIHVESADANLEVRRDDVVLPRALWNTASPIDPGPHVIEARAPSKKTWSTTVDVRGPGASLSVTVPPLAASSNPPSQQPTASVGAEPRTTSPASADASSITPSSGGRMAGFVVAGAGVAAIGVGAVFGLMAKSEDDAAARLCTGGPAASTCANDAEKSDYYGHVDAAKQRAKMAYVGFGVGAVALVTGTVLVLISKSTESSATSFVAPTIARDGAGLLLGGAF